MLVVVGYRLLDPRVNRIILQEIHIWSFWSIVLQDVIFVVSQRAEIIFQFHATPKNPSNVIRENPDSVASAMVVRDHLDRQLCWNMWT